MCQSYFVFKVVAGRAYSDYIMLMHDPKVRDWRTRTLHHVSHLILVLVSRKKWRKLVLQQAYSLESRCDHLATVAISRDGTHHIF